MSPDQAVASSPLTLPGSDLPGDKGAWRKETATLGFSRLEEALKRLPEGPDAEGAARLLAEAESRRFLEFLFAHSPFLTDCIVYDLPAAARILLGDPAGVLNEARQLSRDAAQESDDSAKMKRTLRLARRRAALAIAAADIAEAWPLDRILQALSDTAAAFVDDALLFLLRTLVRRKHLTLGPDEPDLLKHCAITFLGMGKLGAGELNYSSDIDLIVIYDADHFPVAGDRGAGEVAIRLTQDLVNLLSERTADGYVYRVDLRLRPDPLATPLAVSFGAALSYYESLGQNWERAAMIKAAAIAGDRRLGTQFLAEIRPFVWRRSLDFLALQDIHAIKRQIHAQKGGGKVAIEGHNVKLGRGGIREIEFFAQTQQLIWGGRQPRLRNRRTKMALETLAEAEHIKPFVAQQLSDSYDFLRRVEHRLQMVADQQTHSLPDDPRAVDRFADFMLMRPDAFRETLKRHLRTVENHYAELFEDDPVTVSGGNLVFTGDEPDPSTLESLSLLGFAEPQRVFERVRAWHHGRYRATRSTRSREILTGLMPTLLEAFGHSANPDAALAGFDAFLSGLPAGVQLFSLLHNNPSLLELLAEIIGSAPALGERLARRPNLIDSMLEPEFFAPLPNRHQLSAELEAQLRGARGIEDCLDCVRRFSHDRRFQAGVQLLRGLANEEKVGRRLADIADVSLSMLWPRVKAEFSARHGGFEGSGFAVVAMGKLGSREMTITSDLDLVFVYEKPEGQLESDGEKGLDPTTYYARLSQRMINAVTAQTAEGMLYEIDMRLRPSGNAGPVASTLDAFRRYYEEDAWTWELMALTRARVVAGDPDFAEKVRAAICDILCRPRDAEALRANIAEMRERLYRDKPAAGAWDVKMRAGGLIDCEFLTQYWVLLHAATHPGLLLGATDHVLRALEEQGLIGENTAEDLIEAVHLMRGLLGYTRLTMGNTALTDAAMEVASPAIHEGLAGVIGARSLVALRTAVEEAAQRVARLTEEVLGVTLPQ